MYSLIATRIVRSEIVIFLQSQAVTQNANIIVDK